MYYFASLPQGTPTINPVTLVLAILANPTWISDIVPIQPVENKDWSVDECYVSLDDFAARITQNGIEIWGIVRDNFYSHINGLRG
jgi:hypothetical protein